MRKAIEDKTPLAAWATLAREEAGMSVEEVVDALAERGHSVRAATIRGIEGGSKGASVRLRRLMADVYGTKPPGVALERTESGDATAAAIDRQTEVFRQLLDEQRMTRIAQETIAEAVGELVGRFDKFLGGRADSPAERELANGGGSR